jgi:hypothetical protein
MTITTIPYEDFQQKFDLLMLSKPYPKLRDDSETLRHVFNYIVTKYHIKIRRHKDRLNKYFQFKSEFEVVYRRAKAKEKELEAKGSNKAKEPFYFIGGLERGRQKVFDRLRFRRCP